MNKKNKKIILGFAIIVICSIIGYFGVYYIKYKMPNVKNETILKVYGSYTYNQFLDTLEKSGAVNHWNLFKRASEDRSLKNYLKPGRYLLKKGMSNQYLIRMFANGWQTPVNMTFKGYVRRLDNLAYVFSKWFEADSASFSGVLNDSLLIDSLGFSKETFIAMFIPNTYEIYWTITPKNLVLRFNKEYKHFWNQERLSKAKAMNFTPVEVITLASIVAEETNSAAEWPKIAGVYMNRIRKHIPLQACPTVKYVVIQDEPDLRRILNRHLRVDSPYNTYKHRGLPPGPITIAPAAVIDAVLNYEKNDYLYFCAKSEFDGTHNFSSSYSQHKRYSREYNKAFKEWERNNK